MMMTEPVFTTHDYIIGGKLVVGRATMDDTFAHMMNTDVEARQKVKEKLVHDMATFMLENNLVEFTQQDDPIHYTKHIAIRAYIAPNDQVKILRLANKVV